MKSLTIFVLIAAFFLAPIAAAMAKTTNTGGTSNERVANTLAGPPPTPNSAAAANAGARQPGKAELRKSKVKPKPPLTDPN